MSYCRFSEADVYVFECVTGHLECCGCRLGERWGYDTVAEMVAHLGAHRAQGHLVPERVFEELAADEANGLDAHLVAVREREARR